MTRVNNRYRAYHDLPVFIDRKVNGEMTTEHSVKTIHFSMNFVFILQDVVQKDLTTWVKDLETMDETERILAVCQMIYAGLLAYDVENNNDTDYNVFNVRNWTLEHVKDNPTFIEDISKKMLESLVPKPTGKKKASKVKS